MNRTGASVVAFIADQPGGANRLLARHIPDDAGRCRGCTVPGTGTPDATWPCQIHRFASAAADEVARRDGSASAANLHQSVPARRPEFG
jgi:hypothetical protein